VVNIPVFKQPGFPKNPVITDIFTIAQFVSQEHLIFCGVHNTAIPLPHGYNGKLQVSMWTKGGREVVDADRLVLNISNQT
jgi:hypothetical protein